MYLLKYLGHIFIYNSITLENRIKFTAIQFSMHIYINQFVPIEYIDSPVVTCSYCIDEVNVLVTTPLL